MRPAVLGWILLAQTCGGITPALTVLALRGFGPWTLVASRQIIGVFILYATARLLSRGTQLGAKGVTGRDWVLFGILSWAGFGLPQILIAFGLERSTAITGALLAPLEPIGILFGGALILGERLTGARLTAIGLGAAGATLIVLQSEMSGGDGSLFGDGLIAVGHLTWAIYTLAAKPLLERYSPERVSMLAVALTIPPLLPFAAAELVASGGITSGAIEMEAALPAFGWVVALAFVGTAVTTYAWNRALKSVSAGTMAVFIFIQPVVGLAVGALFLRELVTVYAILGATIIVGGVVIAATRGEGEPDTAR